MRGLVTAHEEQVVQLDATDKPFVEGKNSDIDDEEPEEAAGANGAGEDAKVAADREGDEEDMVEPDEEYNKFKDKSEVMDLLENSKLSIEKVLKRYGLPESEQKLNIDRSSAGETPKTVQGVIELFEDRRTLLKQALKGIADRKKFAKLPDAGSDIRKDVHWDFLLKESSWMSDDFKHEKKWKKIKAAKLAREARTVWNRKQQKVEREKRERAKLLLSNWKSTARHVKRFWIKIEKIVTFKHRSKIDETRRLAMDKHLQFMVKQTERYSDLLVTASATIAGGGSAMEEDSDDNKGATPSGRDEDPAKLKTLFAAGSGALEEDDDYRDDPGDEDEDMETLEEEERQAQADGAFLENVKAENSALAAEASAPLESLIPAGYLESRNEATAGDEPLVKHEELGKRKRHEEYSAEKRPRTGGGASTLGTVFDASREPGANGASGSANAIGNSESDQEYVVSDVSAGEEEENNHSLLEEESRLKSNPIEQKAIVEEVSALKNEAEMPLEQLRAMYGEQATGGQGHFDDSAIDDSPGDSDSTDADEDGVSDEDDDYLDSGVEVDDESTLREAEEEGMEDHKSELKALKSDAQMSVEELRKKYGSKEFGGAKGSDDWSDDIDDSAGSSEDVDDSAGSSEDVEDSAGSSEDNSYSDGEGATTDDETTLDVEERDAEENRVDNASELSDLKKCAEMPIEQLRSMYGDAKPGEATDQQKNASAMQKMMSYNSSHSEEDLDYLTGSSGEGDDETTMIEEESAGANTKESAHEELRALRRENEMSVEELRHMYSRSPGEGNTDESSVASTEEDDGLDSNDQTPRIVENKVKSPALNGRQIEGARKLVPMPYIMNPTVTLRHYQREGLHWLASMCSRRLNGILADEMGLGKTIQTISLLAHLASEHGIWGPHLVIVPTSVLLNWEIEFKKFAPAFKVMSYYGSVKQRKEKRVGWTKPNAFHVCVTSYQLAVIDSAVFKRKKWYYLILDEAHYIKNFKSQRWQALLTLNTQRRLLLSGTPLQNNLMELWSLLHFLMPHIFQSQSEFQYWFNNPMTGMVQGSQGVSSTLVGRLHGVIRPFLLRRLKIDVESQLPKKYEHILKVPLARRQQFLYEDFMSRSSTRAKLSSGGYMGQMGVLMALRKVCNHPDLFEPRAIVSPMALKALKIRVPYICQVSGQVDVWRTTSFSMFCLPSQPADHDQWFVNRIRELAVEGSVIEKDAAGQSSLRAAPFSIAQSHSDEGAKWLVEYARMSRGEEMQRRAERAKTLSGVNTSRCRGVHARFTLYNKQLVKAVRVKSVTERTTEDSFTHANHLKYTSFLCSLVLNHYERTMSMKTTVEKFILYIPPASAPSPTMVQTRQFPWVAQFEKRRNGVLKKSFEGDRVFQACHVSRMMRRVLFPDKWLVQYDSGKLQALDKLLHKLKSEGHRCLIFTQMSKMLNVLENFMCLHGHTYFRLDGSTGVEKRQSLTERFNRDKKIFSFILSTRSGGLGINLVGADTVIFYDTDWNPAMDAQAQDRAHRIGQTRDVHIYRLVTEHTVEENIILKANQKRHLNMLAVEEGNFTTDFFSGESKTGPGVGDMKDLLVGTGAVVNATEGGGDTALAAAAMAAAEDEDDRKATKQSAQEMLNDVAEFDETKKLSSASIDDSNVAKRKGGKADSKNAHAQEEKEDDEILEANLVKLWEGKDELGAMKALEDALRPIDRYALGFRQDVEPIWNNVAADAWRQEVLMEASNRELEIEEIEAERLKEEVLLEKSVEMVRAAPSKRGYSRYKKLFLNQREMRETEIKKRRMQGGEWELHRDQKLKRDYYFNTRTGKCTWTKPEVLAIRDAQIATRAGGFGLFPPALLRIIYLYLDHSSRESARLNCLHWYYVGMHRSLWLRVIPNHKLRRVSHYGGNNFRRNKLWGDGWWTEMGMGDSGIGLASGHNSMRSLYDMAQSNRVFDTVKEALENAGAGDTIALEPGIYQEKDLRIQKPVRIIAGNGDGDVYHGIVDSSQGDEPGCFKSISVDGRLKSPLVTIELANRGKVAIDGKFAAVLIGVNIRRRGVAGESDGNSDKIVSASPPIVDLQRGALKMYYCAVHEVTVGFVKTARNEFFSVNTGTLAFLSSCELHGSHVHGVVVNTGGSLILGKSAIKDCNGDGVFVHKNGRAVISESTMSRNAGHGVSFQSMSRGLVRGSSFHDNGKGNVFEAKGKSEPMVKIC
jgi:SNF2 family DNA or RNA helicase